MGWGGREVQEEGINIHMADSLCVQQKLAMLESNF